MSVHEHKSSEALFGDFTPVAQYQIVTVQFPATPNTDKIIRHQLRPTNADDVYFTVMRQSTAGSVYEDVTISRRAWQPGYIVLRADVANWQGTLMLSVLRDRVTEGQ